MSRRRSSDDLVLLTDLSFQFFPGLVPLDQLSGHDFGDTTHLGFGVHYGPRQPHAFVGSVNTSAGDAGRTRGIAGERGVAGTDEVKRRQGRCRTKGQGIMLYM